MAVQAVPTKGNLMNTKKSLCSSKKGLNCLTVSVSILIEK